MAKQKQVKKNGKVYSYDTLVINGVNPKVHEQLINIGKNLGNISVSALLKPRLREIVDSYAPDMREWSDE